MNIYGKSLIIEVPLDESIFAEAEFRLEHMPIYRQSHRQNGANQTGVLGEIVTERWLSAMGVFYTPDKTTQYDIKLLNQEKVDVKTKERQAKPRSEFDCSVALYNHEHQDPDYYFFVSLLRNPKSDVSDLRRFTYAYLLGAVNQQQLYRFGRHIPANTRDEENGMENWTSMLNIPIDLIIPCDQVLDKWKSISATHNALVDYRVMPLPEARRSRTHNVTNKVF